MHPTVNRKLQTCRYWAFGKRCPNINHSDVDLCPYAHWDTGRLSHHNDQRGTCYDWFTNGRCRYGVKCYFEHRDTGYMGLYQRQVELAGLNLEIANAAARSGFNTRNHVGLFDLIWAVHRIALRRSSNRRRPDPHVVYPDRYRPSGVGDNTKRKRKVLEVETLAKTNKMNEETGTSSDPVNIDSADEDEKDRIMKSPHLPVKRQKHVAGQAGRQTPASLNLLHSSRFPHRFRGTATRHVPRTTYMPSARSLNIPPPRDSPSVNRIAPTPLPTLAEDQKITKELISVRTELASVIHMVQEGQNKMRQTYDRFEKIYDIDLEDLLKTMNDNMVSCADKASSAACNVHAVIQWVSDGQEGIQ